MWSLGCTFILLVAAIRGIDLLCQDDKSIDCAKLNAMFGICGVKREAMKICKMYCNLCDMNDGVWSPWSSWAKCDVTCGKGSLLRSRTCTNPAPQNDGLDCAGKAMELKTCNMSSCPLHGGWSSWDNWEKCSTTCGVGMRSRKRSCTNPRPQRFGNHCFGDNIQDELCNNGSCAVNGGWSEWTQWGQCSVPCEAGLQSRTRSCSDPSPINAGKLCIGQNLDVRLYDKKSCQVNGGWSDWTQWGQCSVSCGLARLQSRTRTCTNPTPENAGKHCIGQNHDVRLCFQKLCPGEWTSWQSWTKCIEPCGKKVQSRQRTCSKYLLTMDCQGNATETRTCDECYTDCKDIMKDKAKKTSGVYDVRLWKSNRTIPVYCDFDTDKGGWTVFQYRFNGSVNFYRNFKEYQRGFGTVNGEFWLGLTNMYEMVSQGKTEIRIDMIAADGTKADVTFQNFRLAKGPYYTLYIDKGVGTAGDSPDIGLSYNKGQHFTTFDVDRDHINLNCAVLNLSGWWYNKCTNVNLNGKYVSPGTKGPNDGFAGMIYQLFQGLESLKVSKMMFRRV